jgi:hypothetical protein
LVKRIEERSAPGEVLNKDDLDAYVRAELAAYKAPRIWVVALAGAEELASAPDELDADGGEPDFVLRRAFADIALTSSNRGISSNGRYRLRCTLMPSPHRPGRSL